MKALFVNGSPRKNWNTHKMLKSAMRGAAEAGAETELIHLYDFTFKGCVSCFACKVKNSKTNGLCAFRDALTPALEKAREADVIVMGSPVYFSYPTAQARAFMERLMFPVLSYKTGMRNTEVLNRTIPTAMIYTMGAPENLIEARHYSIVLGENSQFLETLFGYCETLCAINTWQFSDYSRYDVADVESMKAKHREEQFPRDLQNAYELGKRLVEKARESQ